MHVFGIGTDIIDCLRIAKMIDLHGEKFLRRVYTEREIEYCSSSKFATQHYAARWAGKKAVLLAITPPSITHELWTDIEIRPQTSGQTRVAMGGDIRYICLSQGISRVMASISFCHHYATGYAMAISDEDDIETLPDEEDADWTIDPDENWGNDDIPF